MRLILFIISPFLTFLNACFNMRNKSAQIVFVLFFGLFGYCHTFSDMRADSYRKYELFTYYAADDYDDIIKDFIAGETRDIYESLLFSTIKIFTDNPHIMMMIVGLIGGFFYLLIMKRFFADLRMKITIPIAILIIFMVIESNIPAMGGIRNFSALPIYIYSLIRLLIDHKKIWIIGLIAAPLIHIGYIIVSVLAISIWIFKLPNTLLHYLALIACVSSLFLDTASYSGMLNAIMGSVDNEAIENSVSNYTDKDIDSEFNKSLTTRLMRINNQLSACFIALLLIYIRKNRSSLLRTTYIQRLYKILLFFLVVSYALISFSVVGQRFVHIAMVLLLIFMLNIYQNDNNSAIKRYIYAMPFVFIIQILWTIYNCYSNTGFDIYYMPLPFLLV